MSEIENSDKCVGLITIDKVLVEAHKRNGILRHPFKGNGLMMFIPIRRRLSNLDGVGIQFHGSFWFYIECKTDIDRNN
ncbi:6514_t:CDS:2 [Funneliformis caledonium]|uniref:6514_t:CDS:1 n=1 Tax=Funneliformis caledonium TaxID=1117310 RepID=A0A9N9I737_9GLOM|nr:6514_t:CDS:2 [Funneliformis caledonium]